MQYGVRSSTVCFYVRLLPDRQRPEFDGCEKKCRELTTVEEMS